MKRSGPSELEGLDGPSDDSGRDDVDESLRACRSSCSTRAVTSPISRRLREPGRPGMQTAIRR